MLACRTIRGDHSLYIHPSSVLYEQRSPQWLVATCVRESLKACSHVSIFLLMFSSRVVFSEVYQTSKLQMRDITVVCKTGG